MTSIWKIQKSISLRLLFWGFTSILAGTALFLSGKGFWYAFGIQLMAWGIVDALIAFFGLSGIRKRRAKLTMPEQLSQEALRLRRILLLNTALDVFYVICGFVMTFWLIRYSPGWSGHGWGVITQGTFLFFFDLIHAQDIQTESQPMSLQAFQGPEHLPFFLEGGKPGAILVHGFPGTPAEVRPLAESLHQAGWTVKGILLPGFGHQIGTLGERKYEEWVKAIDDSLMEMKRQHSPVVLIGYSMGGSLAIISSTRQKPDGLVLIAPFWRLFSPIRSFIGKILRPFLPEQFQPFKKADFSDPKAREAIKRFMPEVDLDDPKVQEEIRRIKVPVSIFEELEKTGKQAYRKAKLLDIPLMVLQGRNDEVSKPEFTKKLIKRLPEGTRENSLQDIEVNGGHDMINLSAQGWSALEKAVLDFTNSLI